ncbi:16S rRNA (uracil1498-N3)-methyltransferase [Microbacterium sp. cf046]|uniref:16S rRNA (uracil(1498)-N(3))-methyltransferase n=1 Tax=Microbacterium sp. cf046 TaxID=1761803 RepID=UPI0008EDBF51|nr:16S rRNA (uracil(1498)-N(3))-methyltransferase [Microbacterium sp. cf046]SFS05511.1 16S rRNA (uracil1498-N3)-methyltransferase [Microbacterium sp. cf046]
MPLHFLAEDASDAQPDGMVVLTGAEAHHAAAVRRVRVGEEVSLGDGRGVWLTGECEAVTPREVIVRISSRTDIPAPSPRIVLVQALAKGDRDELAVQAATELGVDEIVPWQASRSVSRWDAAKAEKGRARWSSIAREAAKQAHRPWIPEVTPVLTTASLAARAAGSLLVVLEPSAAVRLTELGLDGSDPRDVLLIVGPEGGISAEELAILEHAGATLARLGDTVLRTSTAGPAALAVVSAALQRW